MSHIVTKILPKDTCNYKWPFGILMMLLLMVYTSFFVVFIILIDPYSTILFHATWHLLAQRMCMCNMHAREASFP
jgi:hypothetical protein